MELYRQIDQSSMKTISDIGYWNFGIRAGLLFRIFSHLGMFIPDKNLIPVTPHEAFKIKKLLGMRDA